MSMNIHENLVPINVLLIHIVYIYCQPHHFESDTFDLLDEHLTDRMGVQPNLSVKVSVTIDTMLNFDRNFDGCDDVTCKPEEI